jgi:hypothetical protein
LAVRKAFDLLEKVLLAELHGGGSEVLLKNAEPSFTTLYRQIEPHKAAVNFCKNETCGEELRRWRVHTESAVLAAL